MTCDDFLPALETGGPLRRRRARRHAAGCPRCTMVAARFAAVKQHWAEAPPPLAARQRWLWERAADGAGGEAVSPARFRPSWRLRTGMLAAAASLLIVAIVVRHRPPLVVVGPPPPPATNRVAPATTGVIRVVAIDPAAEFDRLSAAVDDLDAEMRDLRRAAERAEARRQVAAALDHFGP